MKIAIDISQVVYETGVSVYTRNLVISLLELDDKNEYILFGGSLRRIGDLNSFISELKGNFTNKIFPIPPLLADILWNRIHFLPIDQLIGNIDVVHTSDWTEPKSKAFKVTTIHDLAPLKFPKQTHPKIVSTHKRRLNLVKKESQKIIVPSVATMQDCAIFGIDKEKIVVIPEAADYIYTPQNEAKINAVKSKLGIVGEYFLGNGVGGRKNTSKIIKAFQKIKGKTSTKQLVITGSSHNNYSSEDVIFTGHVETLELPPLFAGATSLLYPSLYEGFGLPILESFAVGTPVVTSNRGSMKEVAGNAAILVNPESADSIAEGIIKSIKNKKTLIKKGKSRANKFSWRTTGKQTMKVYEESQSSR